MANFANTKWCKKPEKITETLAQWYPSVSTQQDIYWIPTWQDLDGFSKNKSLCPCALDESSLSIGRVNFSNAEATFI